MCYSFQFNQCISNLMTSIYLVRHGQASFGKKDYDNLSEIGEKQSFLLGEHFKKLKLNFDKRSPE